LNCHHALTKEQAIKLRALLEELGFEFSPKQWTIFFAQKNKLSVAVYEKGPKVLVQGRGVEEFIQFELEPKILGEAKLGYEEVHSPEMFEPHFGVDESGKGDFFGPLVISGVYVDRLIARKLLDAGVVDSKRIGSDARIRALADTIRKISLGMVERVLIGPAKYNELYEKFGNLNRLLGWGHARVIEFAGETGLPTVVVGPVRGCAGDQCVLIEARAQDRHRAAPESGIGHCSSGVRGGARGVHQLAGRKSKELGCDWASFA
jgi:ribonuclease HIII